MAKKEEVLVIPEKQKNGIEHLELLKMLTAQEKVKFDDLQQKVLTCKTQMQALNESMVRTKSDFNQQMNIEKQKFEDTKNQKLNELIILESKLKEWEKNYNERLMSLQERENENVKVINERKELYNLRIEVDRLKRDAIVEIENLSILKSKAEAEIAQADIKIKNSDKELARAKDMLSNAEYKLGLVSEKEKKTSADLENIVKIREDLEPRIAELKETQVANEKTLKEITEKENLINAKLLENDKMLDNIRKESEALNSKKIEIATREEAVLRKEYLTKSK